LRINLGESTTVADAYPKVAAVGSALMMEIGTFNTCGR